MEHRGGGTQYEYHICLPARGGVDASLLLRLLHLNSIFGLFRIHPSLNERRFRFVVKED